MRSVKQHGRKVKEIRRQELLQKGRNREDLVALITNYLHTEDENSKLTYLFSVTTKEERFEIKWDESNFRLNTTRKQIPDWS